MAITDRARFFALDPEVGRCPYPVFQELRRESGLYFEESIDAYVVSRYDDVVEVLRDPDTFSSKRHTGPHVARTMQSMLSCLTPDQMTELVIPLELAYLDGEPHRRLRRLCSSAFSTVVARSAEPMVRETCREVIDGIRDLGQVEFITAFARPMAILTLTRILGLPDDPPRFDGWVRSLIAVMTSSEGSQAVVDGYLETSREFTEYLGARIRVLRDEPDDTILSQLVHTNHDGEEFTDKELISVCLGFIAGGSDNTAALLAAAARRLAEEPALADAVRADPEHRVSAFVDEMLRLQAPIQGMFRTATRPTTVGGTEIPEGADVYLLYTSANRDERVFHDAGTVDLERLAKPSHIGLGHGVHRCLGGPVVLVQARIAVEELLAAFDSLTLACPAGKLPFHASQLVPGITELPMNLHPVEREGAEGQRVRGRAGGR